MIKKPTVFILGAGASNPYGYPLGSDLPKEFDNLVKDQNFQNFIQSSSIGSKGFEDFKSLLSDFKDSASFSIDRFLEHNPPYQMIGKHALAYYFYKKDELDIKRNATFGSDWYQYLFHKIMHAEHFSDFLENNVSFVTFNYDVTLERFFRKTIQSIYGSSLNEDGLIKFFNKIKIYHLHGNIRGFNWQNPFNPDFDKIDLNHAEIRNIGDKYLKLTKEGWLPDVYWMKDLDVITERIIFLGFGFDLDNVAKLQFHWPERTVFYESTSVGLTPGEQNFINREYCKGNIKFNTDWDSLKILREKIDFLTQ